MMPTCPKCNSLAVGDRCGTCGTELKRPSPTAATKLEMTSVSVPGLELGGEPAGTPADVEPAVRHRAAGAYLALQPSETAVLHAASRIFSAFVASGVVTDDNQNELSDRSVKLATRMALVIEKYVQSDDEDW